MGIDFLQTIDHARRGGLGRGLILFLRGLCRVDVMHFFFVELLDIVLFGSATTDLSRGVERIKRFHRRWSVSRCW